MTTTTPPAPDAPEVPSEPSWYDEIDTQITGRELAAVAVAGVLGNLAIRSNITTYAGAGLFVMIVFALLVSRRLKRADSIAVAGMALVLLPWFVVRDDAVLATLNVLTVLTLLGLSGVFNDRRSLFDFGIGDVVVGALSWMLESVLAFPFVARILPKLQPSRRVAPVLRGAIIAAPVVLVLGVLLASADDVFASLFAVSIETDIPTGVGHVLGTAVMAWFAVMFISHATGRHRPDIGRTQRLGTIEATVVLGAVNALFTAFVITRIVTALGGANHIIDTPNLTRSEYARSGFFQLLWVAGIVVAMLATLSAITDRRTTKDRQLFVGMSLTTVALTLAIDGIAIQRLWLYIDAFQFTRLRFWSLTFSLLVGLGLLVLALRLSGWRERQKWVLGAVTIGWVALLLGLNVVAPDAFIARYNLNHTSQFADGDIRELVGPLSDDAIPVLVNALNRDDLPAERIQAELCRTFDEQHDFGFLGSNRSRTKADKLLDNLCGERRQRQRFAWTGSD